jgi:hypothetical protein
MHPSARHIPAVHRLVGTSHVCIRAIIRLGLGAIVRRSSRAIIHGCPRTIVHGTARPVIRRSRRTVIHVLAGIGSGPGHIAMLLWGALARCARVRCALPGGRRTTLLVMLSVGRGQAQKKPYK